MILFQAAATCYIELIVKESDNNVKLIVLDRLIGLKDVAAHEKVLQVCIVIILAERQNTFIILPVRLVIDLLFVRGNGLLCDTRIIFVVY